MFCWVFAQVYCGDGLRLTGQVPVTDRFLRVCHVPADR